MVPVCRVWHLFRWASHHLTTAHTLFWPRCHDTILDISLGLTYCRLTWGSGLFFFSIFFSIPIFFLFFFFYFYISTPMWGSNSQTWDQELPTLPTEPTRHPKARVILWEHHRNFFLDFACKTNSSYLEMSSATLVNSPQCSKRDKTLFLPLMKIAWGFSNLPYRSYL